MAGEQRPFTGPVQMPGPSGKVAGDYWEKLDSWAKSYENRSQRNYLLKMLELIKSAFSADFTTAEGYCWEDPDKDKRKDIPRGGDANVLHYELKTGGWYCVRLHYKPKRAPRKPIFSVYESRESSKVSKIHNVKRRNPKDWKGPPLKKLRWSSDVTVDEIREYLAKPR